MFLLKNTIWNVGIVARAAAVIALMDLIKRKSAMKMRND